MSLKKLANLLAIALGPHILLPLLFILIVLKSGLNSNQLKIIFPTVLLLQVVVPIAYLIIAPRFGWIGKWDMKKKEERRPFFALMLTLNIISLTVIYFFGNKLLFQLNLIFISLLVILFVITIFWKISLHTSFNTGAALIINFLFNWKVPILYLIIPIIFWSRLKLKKHTINQLITGIVVTSVITLSGLALFGYL